MAINISMSEHSADGGNHIATFINCNADNAEKRFKQALAEHFDLQVKKFDTSFIINLFLKGVLSYEQNYELSVGFEDCERVIILNKTYLY